MQTKRKKKKQTKQRLKSLQLLKSLTAHLEVIGPITNTHNTIDEFFHKTDENNERKVTVRRYIRSNQLNETIRQDFSLRTPQNIIDKTGSL